MILLTATQGIILAHIRDACAAGMPPSIVDLCVASNLSFTTVSRAVRMLYGCDLIVRQRSSIREAYVYTPAVYCEDYEVDDAYHPNRQQAQAYPPCTGIAINQAPIEFLPMRMR